MRNFLGVAFVVSVTFLFGCGNKTISGNGHLVKQQKNIGSFSKLVVEGSINVYLKQGNASTATIEADDNLIPYIKLKLENNKLIVGFKKNISVNSSHPINIYLNSSSLQSIALAGSGSVLSTDTIISNNEMALAIAGSGEIKIMSHSLSLSGSITGSGDINLSGTAQNISVDITGSGNFNGENVKTENSTISITGSGTAFVNTSNNLNVHIMGSGNVSYTGNPKINSQIDGSGQLIKK